METLKGFSFVVFFFLDLPFSSATNSVELTHKTQRFSRTLTDPLPKSQLFSRTYPQNQQTKATHIPIAYLINLIGGGAFEAVVLPCNSAAHNTVPAFFAKKLSSRKKHKNSTCTLLLNSSKNPTLDRHPSQQPQSDHYHYFFGLPTTRSQPVTVLTTSRKNK